jgi:hypothetical protein
MPTAATTGIWAGGRDLRGQDPTALVINHGSRMPRSWLNPRRSTQLANPMADDWTVRFALILRADNRSGEDPDSAISDALPARPVVVGWPVYVARQTRPGGLVAPGPAIRENVSLDARDPSRSGVHKPRYLSP